MLSRSQVLSTLILIGAVLVATGWQEAREADVIRAKKILIVGDDGRTVMQLAADGSEGAHIIITDGTNKNPENLRETSPEHLAVVLQGGKNGANLLLNHAGRRFVSLNIGELVLHDGGEVVLVSTRRGFRGPMTSEEWILLLTGKSVEEHILEAFKEAPKDGDR